MTPNWIGKFEWFFSHSFMGALKLHHSFARTYISCALACFFSVFNKKDCFEWTTLDFSQRQSVAYALTAHNSSVWMCVCVCVCLCVFSTAKWIMHLQFNILDSSVHFIKSNEMNACERARQEPYAFHTSTQAQSQIALDQIGEWVSFSYEFKQTYTLPHAHAVRKFIKTHSHLRTHESTLPIEKR